MRAVGYWHNLPVEHSSSLVDLTLECPVPRPNEVLIAVRAIAVNPVDVKVRQSRKPHANAPEILGWDAAGTIAALGDAVHDFQIGDAVYFAGDLTRPGANQEYCCVDARIVAKKPTTLDWAAAAALPLTGLTALEAFLDRMHLPRNEHGRGKCLVVVGGAGGVGSVAIQLARALTHLTVIGTASREQSQAWVRSQGAHHVVDHRQPLRSQLNDLGFDGADYVFCTADSDDYFEDLLDLCCPQATLCFIVNPTRKLDCTLAQRKSLTICWELMFTRTLFQCADLQRQREHLTLLAELVDRQAIRSTVTQTMQGICAATLRDAHAQLERHSVIGKIVIEGWPDHDAALTSQQ